MPTLPAHHGGGCLTLCHTIWCHWLCRGQQCVLWPAFSCLQNDKLVFLCSSCRHNFQKKLNCEWPMLLAFCGIALLSPGLSLCRFVLKHLQVVFSPFVEVTRSHCSQETSLQSVSGNSISSKQHFRHTRSMHALFLGSHTIMLTNSEMRVAFNRTSLGKFVDQHVPHAHVSLSLVFSSVIKRPSSGKLPVRHGEMLFHLCLILCMELNEGLC